MKKTEIEWARSTFNPWWGCEKVSPGCAKCYAETFAKRVGQHVWGADAPRRFFGDKHWAEPLRWNAEAAASGEPWRVFCASMADVFEDRPDLVAERDRLFAMIDRTPALTWLLLTKRPEKIQPLWPFGFYDEQFGWANLWLGTTVENQEAADRRIPELLAVPAALRFLSVEPLLGPVDLGLNLRGMLSTADDLNGPRIGWVIVGGESGPGARPCDLAWIRDVVRQCREAGVPVFVKQLGANPCGRFSDRAPIAPPDVERIPLVTVKVRGKLLHDPKGGDPLEWPSDLRVRELPTVGGAS